VAASAATIVAAPVTESAVVIASATTVERILERPKLMITRALPSGGVLAISLRIRSKHVNSNIEIFQS
jgi:hypothetical protein